MPKMNLSANGLATLQAVEGFMPKLYDDVGKGQGHCTIGYGHLVHYNPCDVKKYASEVQFQNGITVKQAESLLKSDYAFAETAVNDLVKVPLNQNQFDALVLFVFNIGRAAFAKSALLKKLNNNRYQDIPAELRRWNKSNGVVLSGLTTRRQREINLFNKKVSP